MLPANAPVLAALALPLEYAVTNAAQAGERAMLAQVEARLAAGLKMIQVREPGEARSFADQVIARAHRHGAKVLTKQPHAGADGIHFTAVQLMALRERPGAGLAAASCHTREELERAMQLGLDFVVLGPVKDKAAIGWQPLRRDRDGREHSGLRDRRPRRSRISTTRAAPAPTASR